MAAVYDDLAGRHVLITGGAGGIGSGVAAAFAGQRSRVSVLDKDAPAGAALAQRLRAQGADVAFFPVDLTDFDALVPLLRRIEAERGPVTVLVNNAGWDPRYDLTAMTWEQWDSLFRLNVGHYFVTCRELIPGMARAGGGSILMTASCMFWLSFPDCTCYNATKGAIIGMVHSLAREVGKKMIRVNAVAPGWVLTERQVRDLISPQRVKKLLEEDQALPIPLTPEELAGTYLFLASDQARCITRQTILVDGGWAHSV